MWPFKKKPKVAKVTGFTSKDIERANVLLMRLDRMDRLRSGIVCGLTIRNLNGVELWVDHEYGKWLLNDMEDKATKELAKLGVSR